MEFELKATFNTTAELLFTAWLDSGKHSIMTGGAAEVSNIEGNSFTAWDGYIVGRNLVIEPYKRIVQSWRAADFEAGHEDSEIELHLNETDGKTELTLIHRNLPDSIGEQYRQGWVDHYFSPMSEYFL